VSAYIGDGANRWPAVDRLDAAALFRLALEKAPAGQPLHGAAENVTLRGIAEQVARILGIPAVSLTLEQAAEHFGDPFMARVFAADAPVSSEASRTLLGWTPAGPTLLHDIETGDYCTV
jgi:nucleoside-diphosphate-sugar epimerase